MDDWCPRGKETFRDTREKYVLVAILCDNIVLKHTHKINALIQMPLLSLPGMQWGCVGSLDMLRYEEMRSPTSSQETALLYSLLELSQPWESLGRI
jgi:hypothetical protein